MAQAGEIEVFRITPVEGKCYEHIEATRSVYVGGGNRRYFSRKKPKYVGEFTHHVRYGWGDGGEISAFFKNNKIINEVKYTYEGNTCFIEVPCIRDAIESKAINQAIRNIYESKTNQSAAPGHGPADLIRGFVGIKVPKGAEGGKRSIRRKRNKKRKTRSRK